MKFRQIVHLPPRNGIQVRLVKLVLIVTLPLSALWGWFVWSELKEAERAAYASARLMVDRTISHLEATLKNYEIVTSLLGTEYDVRKGRWDPGFSTQQFVRLHPEIVGIGVYRPTEQRDALEKPSDNGLPEYLERSWPSLRQVPKGYAVSGAVWENTAKRWVVVITRIIHDSAASPEGLVYLTLDLKKLNDAVMGAGHPDILMPVADRANRILMRSLEPEKWIGQTLPPAIVEAVKGKNNEDFLTTDLQGHRRLYAMKTMEMTGWRVLAGIREDAVAQGTRARYHPMAALGLITLLTLFAAAWRNANAIGRPITDLSKAIAQLRTDPTYRVQLNGPQEVQKVAAQLNTLLDRIHLEQQERKALADHYGSIVNNARDSIILMSGSQRIVDCNPTALQTYGYNLDEMRRMTAKELRVAEARESSDRDWNAASAGPGILFETIHQRKNGTTFPVEVSSSRFTIDGEMYVQSFIRDITERKVFELALARQTRALIALSACNHALIGAKDVQPLLNQICKVMVTTDGYRMAWVGRPEHNEAKDVSVWAQSGEAAQYLENIKVSWADTPLGRGPTGTAIREFRTVLAHDLARQAGYEPWRTAAKEQGFASSISLPLTVDGHCLGVLNVYSAKTDAFDTSEVGLLEELASNVALGISDLQTRQRAVKLQSQLGASDQRFQMLIEQSPAGIYVIRHGIFVYANPRMDDIMGVAYGTLVSQRAQDFVVAEDWHILTEATERMNLLGSTGHLHVRCRRRDGVVIEMGLQNVTSDYEGEPAIIGMAQDISERVRDQAEIQQYILKLERTTEATLQAVSNMVEQRDPYTAGHERRVGELAGAIGAEMGLNAHQVKGLRLAGFVHDVGKIAVPAELLAKPSRLSEAEMALIRVHPQVGYDVLKDIEFPWPIAQIILQHHERLDGSGYPRGLHGNEILQEARIMMVADVVESMSSHRPYRPGLGIEAALAEIAKYSGVRYEPEVVDACQRLFQKKAYKIPD